MSVNRVCQPKRNGKGEKARGQWSMTCGHARGRLAVGSLSKRSSRAQSRGSWPKTVSLTLSPVLATLPKNSFLTPLLATLPKIRFRNSFVCHTYEPPGDVLGRFPCGNRPEEILSVSTGTSAVVSGEFEKRRVWVKHEKADGVIRDCGKVCEIVGDIIKPSPTGKGIIP